MLFGFFRNDKFVKSESSLILTNMATYASSGRSIENIFDALIGTEVGARRNLLSEMKTLHIRRLEPLAQVFYKYNLITQSEYKLLDEVDDFAKAIDIILSLREGNNRIKEAFRSTTTLPFLVTVIVPILAGLFSYKFVLFLSDMANKVKKNGAKELDFFAFMNHPEYLIAFGFFVLIAYVSFIAYYKHLEKSDLQRLYELFPLKAYEDFPNILKSLQIYSEKGLNDVSMAKTLSVYASPVGIRKMFAVGKNDTFTSFSKLFRRFNIPYDITSFFEAHEKSDTLYEASSYIRSTKKESKNNSITPIDWLLEYCDKTIDTRLNFLLKKKFGIGLKNILSWYWYSIFFGFILTFYYTLMNNLDTIRDLAEKIGSK